MRFGLERTVTIFGVLCFLGGGINNNCVVGENSIEVDAPPPSCDSCPDQTDIVCNAEGFAFPNKCFALCIGVSAKDIGNCSSTLLQEVEDAFKLANAHCLNATCGATCSLRANCGWDSTIHQCVAGEITSEEELSMGDCAELNANDECNAYTCGANCSVVPHCGWDSQRMICATGHVTSNAEIFMGSCELPEMEFFDMCAEFRPCLNNGNCTTAGDYRFTCDCLPGYSGMVCENDETRAADIPAAKKAHTVTKSSNVEHQEDDDPFKGMFIGDPITSANAMVISIIVLLVSVLTSATVLYFRRRKLRRDAVNLDSYIEGYIGEMPRKKMNLIRNPSQSSLEYDDNRAVLGIGVDDSPQTKKLQMVNSPVPPPRSSVGSPVTMPRGISLIAEQSMKMCHQCKEEAPIANGSIDETDMKWYCNVCWRVMDESKTAEC